MKKFYRIGNAAVSSDVLFRHDVFRVSGQPVIVPGLELYCGSPEEAQAAFNRICEILQAEDLTRLAEQEATAQKPERWVPEMGKKYFCVSNDADEAYIRKWHNDKYDRTAFAFGNVFRTREEAEAKRAEIIGDE